MNKALQMKINSENNKQINSKRLYSTITNNLKPIDLENKSEKSITPLLK